MQLDGIFAWQFSYFRLLGEFVGSVSCRSKKIQTSVNEFSNALADISSGMPCHLDMTANSDLQSP